VGNDRERRGPKIEEWDTLETLVEHRDYFGRNDFLFKVAVEQPIAEGGRRLFKRLNAEIRFGRHFIRLNTKAITTLLRIIDEHRETIDATVERIHAENDEMRREEQKSRDRPKPGAAGSGLSANRDPNAEGKTARRRRKERERARRDAEGNR
jgi:hypothetical protein